MIRARGVRGCWGVRGVRGGVRGGVMVVRRSHYPDNYGMSGRVRACKRAYF